MRKRFGTSVLATLVVGVAFAAPASAATIANWQMNEGPGAHAMIDSGPNHINGTIGTSLTTGTSFMGAIGYTWPFRSPTNPPADVGRLVQASSSKLNPGSGNYTVTFRYRTNQHFGNMIQKGQGGAKGGYFKIENPNGAINCMFRGTNSKGAFLRKDAQSPIVTSDNQWHTVTCARTSSAVTLTIDGNVVATAKGSSGTITNNNPITIAGKLNCDNVKTTCDYYTGSIDYITISN